MKLLRASVEIVVCRWNDGGAEYLTVTNRKFGGFSMPGGKVEEDETVEEAAHRELLEETGLQGTLFFLAADLVPAHDGQDPWVCMVYTLTCCSDLAPKQMEEGTVPGWRTRDDIVANGRYTEHYKWLFDRILL